MSGKDFIGQERWQRYFAQVLREHRLTHAYLISGPAHLGKRMFVESMAKAVLCRAPHGAAPCGECGSCAARRGTFHPDLTRLGLGEGESTIGVEAGRAFIAALAAAPTVGAHRVGVIFDADRMTIETANVLLKTLEEPPSSVVLFVVASSPESLPATVRSRLAHLAFAPVAEQELVAALRERGVSHRMSEELAALSVGRPGLALAWARDAEARKRYEATGQEFADLCLAPLALRFAAVERLADHEVTSQELDQTLQRWQLVIADVLRWLAGARERVSHVYLADRFQNLEAHGSLVAWAARYRALERARWDLSRNANRRLALNTFFLSL